MGMVSLGSDWEGGLSLSLSVSVCLSLSLSLVGSALLLGVVG